MFYEQKVINGVLHYRTIPDAEWMEMSKAMLTSKLMEASRTAGRVISSVRAGSKD